MTMSDNGSLISTQCDRTTYIIILVQIFFSTLSLSLSLSSSCPITFVFWTYPICVLILHFRFLLFFHYSMNTDECSAYSLAQKETINLWSHICVCVRANEKDIAHRIRNRIECVCVSVCVCQMEFIFIENSRIMPSVHCATHCFQSVYCSSNP